MRETVLVLADEERFEGIYLDKDEAERDRVALGLAEVALREVALAYPPTCPCMDDDWSFGMDYVDSLCHVAYRLGVELRELVVFGGSLDARTAVMLREMPNKPEFARFAPCGRDSIGNPVGRFTPDDELEPPHLPTQLALDLYEHLDYRNCYFLNEVVSDIVWLGIDWDNLSDREAEDETTMRHLEYACLSSIECYWDQFSDSYGFFGASKDEYETAETVHGKKVALNLWSSVIHYGIPYLATAVHMIMNDDFPGWWLESEDIWRP